MEIKAAVAREQGGQLPVEPLTLEAPRSQETLVQVVATGGRRLVRFYNLDQINEAIEDYESGKTIKPIIRMQ